MAGIGTAARNWDEEQKKGIGTAAQKLTYGVQQLKETPRVPPGEYKQPTAQQMYGINGQQEQLSKAGYQQQPINVMEGVTSGTKERLNQLEQGYQQSDAAQNAQQALLAIQAQKPQGYTSKYSGQLEDILQQLKGQKFNYSLNEDTYFQSLKDNKVQLAKQASMDAMGQAAGLTGGYGSSAAQSVANQAYQNALLGLNDDALNSYNLALQQYQIEQQGLGNQFNMLNQLEQNQYGQYRDTVGDWQNERNYAANMYNTEEDRSYNRYQNDLNYQMQKAQIENADYRSEQERQEAIRQFNEQYALQREQFDYGKEQDAIANALRQAQFDYGKEQDALAQQNWQTQFDYGKEQDAIANALRQAQLDYGKEQDAQSQANWQAQFDYNKQQDAQSQANWQQQMDYQAMQDMLAQQNWQETMDYNKKTSDQKYYSELALMMLQNGQMPSDAMLAAAGMTAEDAQKLMAQIVTGGGGGGNKKQPVYYVDIAGNYYQDDGKGGYTPVRPQDVDPNGLEDRSKINQITGQNLANTWTAASNAQADQRAAQNAALAAQRQAADQQKRDSQAAVKQMLDKIKNMNLLR